MNADERKEAESRLDAIENEAGELRKLLTEPAEVFAYIGTEVDEGFSLYGKDTDGHKPWTGQKPDGHFTSHDSCTIDGQPVTRFQPVKAEIRVINDHSVDTYVNGLFMGNHAGGECAPAKLRDLAKSIAPWWSGELVITERE